MLSRPKSIRPVRPPVDEWGIYDPEQAGLAAVAARLESRRRATAVHRTDAESLAASMREANDLADKEKP
jgi:hypothetical protein